MSLANSSLISVQDIPDAGRGVISKQDIPANTVLLSTAAPAAHTTFRHYRKEVCAQCFAYDRGRTLPVRDASTGKAFCAAQCQSDWTGFQGEIGVKAWQAVHSFVQTNAKAAAGLDVEMGTTPRPTVNRIDDAWQNAEQQATSAGSRKRSEMSHYKRVDADILGYFLAGVIHNTQEADEWHEVSSLAMDLEPYRSTEELESYCQSYVQLSRLLHAQLRSSCTTMLCRTLVNAGSHNAFGIRAGGEDAEEYMGYGIWPIASYFNHSCAPNVVKERIGTKWVFRAAREIVTGDECCITYLGGDEKGLDVKERRARLSEVWGFECQCCRCVDEAGSSNEL